MKNNLIFISPKTKVTDIILNNPNMLIIFEHFGICYEFNNKLLEEVCSKYNLETDIVVTVMNLFNGHNIKERLKYSYKSVETTINFLKSNHSYYSSEKYPKLKELINKMVEVNDHPKIIMVNKFFDLYYAEVVEHFEYENNTVFPYAIGLITKLNNITANIKDEKGFSIAEFKDNHEDIEEKLMDLTNLLLKYLPVKNDLKIRRELLLGIYELEHNLSVHQLIEDNILVPMLEEAEKRLKNEQ